MAQHVTKVYDKKTFPNLQKDAMKMAHGRWPGFKGYCPGFIVQGAKAEGQDLVVFSTRNLTKDQAGAAAREYATNAEFKGYIDRWRRTSGEYVDRRIRQLIRKKKRGK